LVGDRERIQEARTGCVDVERTAAGHAQPLLQQAGRGREDQVRRGGADDDQVEFVGTAAGSFERAYRRVVREVHRGLAFGGDVALTDAGARGDPLVAGVDDLRQVVVGQHLAGKVAAGTGDT